MKYVNESRHTIELRFRMGEEGRDEGIARIPPFGWFEPISGWYGDRVLIRVLATEETE